MLAQLLSDIPLERMTARVSEGPIGTYLLQVAKWMGASNGYARLMLALGRPFKAQPLPSGFTLGTVGQCFANAGSLALNNPSLTYVEGLADCGFLPTAHAWCVDAEGRVIDPTWRDCATASYFGIPVQWDALHEHLDHTGYWGLFDGALPRRLLDGRLDEFVHQDWITPEMLQLLPQCFKRTAPALRSQLLDKTGQL
jgi:hypothetical protein